MNTIEAETYIHEATEYLQRLENACMGAFIELQEIYKNIPDIVAPEVIEELKSVLQIT